MFEVLITLRPYEVRELIADNLNQRFPIFLDGKADLIKTTHG